MLSPPPPLDQETPLSDSVNDMPVNDSTVDDIRFWAIKKFSEMNRKIVNLTQRSNHHLESITNVRDELKTRPSYEDVTKFVREASPTSSTKTRSWTSSTRSS